MQAQIGIMAVQLTRLKTEIKKGAVEQDFWDSLTNTIGAYLGNYERKQVY